MLALRIQTECTSMQQDLQTGSRSVLHVSCSKDQDILAMRSGAVTFAVSALPYVLLHALV